MKRRNGKPPSAAEPIARGASPPEPQPTPEVIDRPKRPIAKRYFDVRTTTIVEDPLRNRPLAELALKVLEETLPGKSDDPDSKVIDERIAGFIGRLRTAVANPPKVTVFRETRELDPTRPPRVRCPACAGEMIPLYRRGANGKPDRRRGYFAACKTCGGTMHAEEFRQEVRANLRVWHLARKDAGYPPLE